MRKKCSEWLNSCNDDTDVDAHEVLGRIIQNFMDQPPPVSFFDESPSRIEEGQERIKTALPQNQLSYWLNVYITRAESTPIPKTLEDYLKSGDFSSIEKEFERTVDHIQTDPHASVTAACSIIESALRFYIKRFNLVAPNKSNVMPLWAVVQPHLSLNADATLAADQHKMLKGISSIIDGVGAFRSHIGSAYGRGSSPPSIMVAETRLVVNVAQTLVVFIMEMLHAKTV